MAVQQSSFTRDQFLDRVRGDLGARSQSYVTDADIIAWGHEAARIIAFETHWLRTSASQNVTDGTLLYDLPTDAIAIAEVWHGAAGSQRQLVLNKEKRLAQRHWNADWRAVEGTPREWYLKGMTSIGLYPTPDTTITNGLKVFYSYWPAAPANGSATYSVPTVLDYSLIVYAKMRACEKDKTGEGREGLALYRAEWSEVLGKLKELVGDVAEGELLILGADRDFEEDNGVYEQLWDQTLIF